MPNDRVKYLDALRGIAALTVLLHHAWAQMPYANLLKTSPYIYMPSGHSCVCLFFILSGFVLSYKFIGESGQTNNLVRSIIKRPIRLFGVMAAVSIIGYALQHQFVAANYSVILNLLFTDPFSVGIPVVPPLWTIGVEFTGSVVTFVLLILMQNKAYLWRLLILIGALIFYRNSYTVGFVLGMMVADWLKYCPLPSKNTLSNVGSLLLLPLALWLFSHREEENIFNAAYLKSITSMIGALLVFIVVCLNGPLQRLLQIRPLLFLGRISFSLYAVHWLFTTTCYNLIIGHLEDAGCGRFCDALTFLISIAISIGAAWVLTKHIDEPCIEFSRWFSGLIISPNKTETQERYSTHKTVESLYAHEMNS